MLDPAATAPLKDVTLYAFSALSAGNMVASSRPAAAFVLAVENSPAAATNVSFVMNLPLRIEVDQLRAGSALPRKAAIPMPNASSCLAACDAESACQSWQFVQATSQCTLQSDAPLNSFAPGITSGLAGYWIIDNAAQCLTLVRPGNGPMHGNVSMCVTVEGGAAAWSAGHVAEPSAGLDRLMHGVQLTSVGAAAYGQAMGSVLVPAGGNATITITMGWNMPYRDHFNYDHTSAATYVPFGNQYSTHFPDGALQSAWGDAAPGEARSAALMNVLSNIQAWHGVIFGSSLPTWLQDLLVNSLSHTRNAMWFQQCPHCLHSKDPRVNASSWGIWRQW